MVLLVHPERMEVMTVKTELPFVTFFFGFVHAFRGDLEGFRTHFLFTMLTFGVYPVVAILTYNKEFAQRKILEGWLPATKHDYVELFYENVKIFEDVDVDVDSLPKSYSDLEIEAYKVYKPNLIGVWLLVLMFSYFWFVLAMGLLDKL